MRSQKATRTDAPNTRKGPPTGSAPFIPIARSQGPSGARKEVSIHGTEELQRATSAGD